MKEQTKTKLKKVCGIVLDVLVTLALVCSVTTAIVIAVQRAESGFVSYGMVQSESMTASGLNVGDVVKVRPQDEYSLGDIIVFYRAPEKYDETFDVTSVKDCEIWIHEVVDIGTDALGRKTYLTQGSSNATNDGAYVPQDFVLGKARKLNNSTIAFINFVCSVKGIILLVEIPCGLVLVYLVWDLVMYLTKDKKDDSSSQEQQKDNSANEEQQEDKSSEKEQQKE